MARNGILLAIQQIELFFLDDGYSTVGSHSANIFPLLLDLESEKNQLWGKGESAVCKNRSLIGRTMWMASEKHCID